MILLDVTDTSFGQDIMAVTNKLVIVICVGVALKIIQTLYALAGESITADKAKNKIKQLFKVIIIAVSLSELSDTIVNGYLLSRDRPESRLNSSGQYIQVHGCFI